MPTCFELPKVGDAHNPNERLGRVRIDITAFGLGVPPNPRGTNRVPSVVRHRAWDVARRPELVIAETVAVTKIMKIKTL